MEQECISRDRLREIASAIRALQAEAKRAGEGTLAYLIDMAAMEAKGRLAGLTR